MNCPKCGSDRIDTGLRCCNCGTQLDFNNNPANGNTPDLPFVSTTLTVNYGSREVK